MTDFSITGLAGADAPAQIGENVMTQGVGFPLRAVSASTAINYEALPAAEVLAGSELVALSQAGTGVKSTISRLALPVVMRKDFNLAAYRSFSLLGNTPRAYINTVDNTKFGSEPYIVYMNGAGSSVGQGSLGEFAVGVASLQTGTTTTGYASIESTDWPIFFVAGMSMDTRFIARLPVVSSGANTHYAILGFGTSNGAPQSPIAAITSGGYFKSDLTAGNWAYEVKNAAGTFGGDTGIAIDPANYAAFRVYHDPNSSDTTFYINGALVGTVTGQSFPVFSIVVPRATIVKTLNTTTRYLHIQAMSHNIVPSGGAGLYEYMV